MCFRCLRFVEFDYLLFMYFEEKILVEHEIQ